MTSPVAGWLNDNYRVRSLARGRARQRLLPVSGINADWLLATATKRRSFVATFYMLG